MRLLLVACVLGLVCAGSFEARRCSRRDAVTTISSSGRAEAASRIATSTVSPPASDTPDVVGA